MARYLVVTSDGQGNISAHPMKDWLRKNEKWLPGIDPAEYNSQSLRRMLHKKGWQSKERPDELYLIMPGLDVSDELIDARFAQEPPGDADDDETAYEFALESHLRDFLAKNLQSVIKEKKLNLFEDIDHRNGVEYPTGVGPIDILAVDAAGNFFVFELKLSRGVDKAVGQLLRYMGWVKRNLAKGKQVNGVVLARIIDDKLKYAASIIPEVTLLEYQVNFNVRPVSI